MKFFGRDDLLLDLDALWGKGVSSLVTCRGRRRIGKSTLIKEFAMRSGARFIKIEGLKPEPGFTNENELRSFADQLGVALGRPCQVPANWLEAFKRLADALDDTRTVVLLDEISWLAYFDSTFAGTFKIAWDNFLKGHDRLMFVLCGSVSSWIKDNVIKNKAYYGRRSLDIVVPELPLCECARFWGDRVDRVPLREIIDILSVTGGVPRYLEEINPSLSADENIRRMAFRPNSILRVDFDEMFCDVITRQPKFTARVLEALVNGAHSVSELAGLLGVDKGGHVSEALDQLVEAGMVAPDIGKNPETGAFIRERRFRLSDNYTRFYLKCIRPAAPTIDEGAFAMSTLSQFLEWDVIAGLAFENLIVNHYRELLPFLHLADSLVYSAAPYRKNGKKGERDSGFQIDLLIQTRRSNCVVEIKRRREIPYGIIDEVAEKVRRVGRLSDGALRAALVYDGDLAASVPAEGYFDAIIPFSRLLGI